MTGFPGERTNRPVALVTEDFRTYHELAPYFEERGITLLGLRPEDPVPDAVQVLLDGPADDARSIPILDRPDATWVATVAALAHRRTAKKAILGIDPGATIGLALLADGIVLDWAECYSIEDLAETVAAWMPAIDAKAWHAHVGNGAPEIGRDIRRALRPLQLTLSTVSETGSTPQSPATGSRHADAAILIAMRQP